jgi:type IV pilus assembly protein PilB
MNSFKEIFFEKTGISKERLDQLLSIQKKKGVSLRRIMIDEGLVSEDVLTDLLSRHLYMPVLCLNNFKFGAGIIDLFPEYMAKIYNAVPLLRNGNTFIIATSEPLNILALADLNNFCRCNTVLVLSPEDEVTRAIGRLYGKEVADASADTDSSVFSRQPGEPVEKLVDIVLASAVSRKASDIHIEPELDCLRIRYRVDGALQDVLKVPKINQNSFLARLKMISDFDISENRIPQDGKFNLKAQNRLVEFRVSSLPTTFGQKFVLHALDKNILNEGLEGLGFSENTIDDFKSAAAKPSGLILFGGPVGSGKTTTLYAILNQLNISSSNIVTIEDPVESPIAGITQVQLNPEAGLDFSRGFNSALRQRPDVIMVDQIRDAEAADAVVRAALSGQLVFSAVQSEDAFSAINRIIEMGVEPFLVASSLVMVCSQRLARKICVKCRKPGQITKGLLGKTGFSVKDKLYTSEGCGCCNQTGFSGRLAISETALIDDAIRDIIISGKPADEIRGYAVKNLGFKSLRDDAYLKARDGLISLDEAIRIVSGE